MTGAVLRVKIFILVLWVCLKAPLYLHAGENRIEFEHVTSEASLADGTILCIFQDSKGFLWFGTTNGLIKFDGYDCKTYWHQLDDLESLSDNVVRAIIEDRSGALWIGTVGGGLNKFSPKTETFTHYQQKPGNPNSLNNNNVVSLCQDRAGKIWIGTMEGGLDKFDPQAEIFTHYQSIPGNPHSLSDNNVLAIIEDRSGALWIGTLNGGLNHFSPGTGMFARYPADPANPGSLSNNYVSTIVQDQDREDILWIGTLGGGVNKFDTRTGEFTRFTADAGDPKSLSSNNIKQIYPDKTGALWVGTQEGLNRFDRKKQEFTRYLAAPGNPGCLSANAIRSLYEDRSGVLWIGTEFGGLNKFNRMKKKFYHYYHSANDPNSLSNNMVMVIYEDRVGVPWIGTMNGLNKWDRENNKFIHYRNEPGNPTSLSNNHIWCIHENRSGEFWIGTFNGLNRFDRKKGEFACYRRDAGDPNSLSDNSILSICEDRQGFSWFGTSNGLNRFDRVNRTFKRYWHDPMNPHSLSHNTIITLFEDSDGVLWVGTLAGLNKFNRKTDTFTRYRADPGNPGSLSSDKINCIYEDRSGITWLGTYGGLNRFDRKRDTFTHYSKKDGLPSDLIMGVLEDDGGYLWLSTDNGLSKFNPQTGECKNYDSGDGLQGNRFIYARCKSKNGEMFFGGVNGFNAFFPGSIIDNPYQPGVVITDFKLYNKSVGIGEEIDGRIILENHISETDEIQLSTKHTTLSFEYVGLHYAAPNSIRYAYKMEGLEKHWNYVGHRRFAIYPHLDPGYYVFQVKASNEDNAWNETGASVKIYIPPPYWQQWWFRGLLGAIFILLLFAGYYYRTRQLRKRLAEQQRVQKLLKQSRDEMMKSRDIAEFRSAENEKLIAAISSIFITVDADGKISQWNHPAEKFFNIPLARVKAQLFVDILKEYIPGYKLEEILEKARHQDKAVDNIEIQVNFPNANEPKQLMATINRIIDKSGKKFGFLFLAEDITHQKKEQMQVLVSQKLEALGQMAAGIAHEIRSPLQYIGDNVRFLLENFDTLMESCVDIKDSIKKSAESGKNVDTGKLIRTLKERDFDFFIDEMPRALDHIINGVSRVSHIVKSMTEFSHIGKEAHEKADLNEMLKTTLVVAHARIKNAAELETDYAEGLPPLYCCIGELNQVFLNLLINAADAVAETGKHGLIKVSTRQTGSELIVEISDNGIGVPDEIKDKIFAPFFTTKKIGYGTGQGLPFSYSIVVTRHKGKIYFKSKVNEGTTFFVHLPAADETEEDQEAVRTVI